MKTIKNVLITAFIIMLFIVAGCNSDSSTSTEDESSNDTDSTESNNDGEDDSAGPAGELKIAVSAQPPTLDPQMTTATIALDVTRNIFETLVTMNGDYQPVPMLSESIDVSEDGKTYTFHLREGVTFHNDKEMTSEDVVASMNRWAEVSSKAKLLGEFEFEATDTYTVILNLQDRYADVLDVLAGPGQFPAIMPKEVIESASAEGVTEYIGTGPFKFKEWKQDQYIVLEAYQDYVAVDEEPSGYAGKKAALVNELYYYIVTDPSTRLAGIQTGEYDIVEGMPFDSYEQLQSMPDVDTHLYYNGTISVIYNKKEGIMTDKNMRQAVNTALDMGEIMLASFSNEDFFTLDPGFMNFNQVNWATDAGKESYNQADPELAQKLMKEAGYNGEEIRLIVTRDYDYHYNAAVVVKEQLEQAGAKASLEVYDWATLLEQRKNPEAWDLFFTSIAYQQTPAQLLELDPEYPGWTDDPTITDLLQKIRTAESQDEAKRHWEELQEFLWNDYVPSSLFGHNTNIFASSNKVEGLKPFRGIIPWNVKVNQ